MDEDGTARTRRGPLALALPAAALFVVVLLLAPPASPSTSPAGPASQLGGPAREVSHLRGADGTASPPVRTSAAPINATWQPSGLPGPSGASPPRTGAAMAWDPRDGYLVLFGGNGSQGPTDTTWTFSAGGWTNRTNASDAPPAMFGAAMDFDYALDAIVLFGGCGPSACPSGATWLYDGGVWANVTNRSIGQPAPRYDASLGFANDSADRGSVLFGGCLTARCSVRANDTWTLNTTLGWVPESPYRAPPPTSGAPLAFDPGLGGLLLFGGCLAPGCAGTSTTWLYQMTNWSLLGGAVARSAPPPDPSPSATFDAANGLFLVVSGAAGGPGYPWSLSCSGGCQWTNQTGATDPDASLPSQGAVMAQESGTIPPALVGGVGATPPGPNRSAPSVWVLEPTLGIGASVVPAVAPARSTVQGFANATGGTAPFDFRWAVGTEGTSAQNVSLEFSAPGVYGISVTVSDAYGVEAATNLTERATGPSVAATASPGTVDEGVPVHFLAVPPMGGTPPYNITWQWPNGTFSYGPAVDGAFSSLGPQQVGVLVTDARGVSNATLLTILVVARPAVTITSPRPTTDAGGTANFSAVVVGGVLPVSYNWTFGGGVPNATGPWVDPRFPSAGQFLIHVEVTDGVGAVASAWANVTVNAPVGVEVLGANASTGIWGPIGPVVNGSLARLRALPENGTPEFTIGWRITDPRGSVEGFNGSWLNLSVNETGTYDGVATITDGTGAVSNASFQLLSIGPSSGGCGSCGSVSDLLLWEIGVAVVLVLAAVGGIAAAVAARRRDRLG